MAKPQRRAATAMLTLAIIVAFLVAGAVLGSGRAIAGPVSCGDTITTDTTLEGDLIDCPNNGIVIGADDITLDLNGHTIDGDDALVDPCPEICDIGVFNGGHDGVTVRHGSVREFSIGVFVAEVSHNRLLGISSSRNQFSGLGFFRGTRSLVRNCSVSSTARGGGPGMFLVESDHDRVLNSSFRNNGDQGIFVGNSDRNLIKGNLFSHNGFYGVILEEADRNQVRGNRSVQDGEVGFYVAPGNRNVIVGNHVTHSGGRAIEVDGGDDNVIARNWARDAMGDAIIVGCGRPCSVVVGTVVSRNHIRGAGEDGVHIDARTKDTIISRNHVSGAKDDGLDANSPTTTLTRNKARNNNDLGIEAVEGVIDGGGNRASGNGDPRQCVNVSCS
jgi:parallel beta-helix repeat protein